VRGWSGAPKESAFIAAIGRAPMVKTSRRMPPTPGRRALMRFDVAGVVVAFHLEDQRQPVADIDDAGILARAADHLRALGGQGAQPFLRRLVGTMLVPHRGKDAEFGEAGFAADDLQDAVVFVGLQPVGGDKFRRDLRFGHGGWQVP
jgi:hypothetical protein